jgi:hypothetical protein
MITVSIDSTIAVLLSISGARFRSLRRLAESIARPEMCVTLECSCLQILPSPLDNPLRSILEGSLQPGNTHVIVENHTIQLGMTTQLRNRREIVLRGGVSSCFSLPNRPALALTPS